VIMSHPSSLFLAFICKIPWENFRIYLEFRANLIYQKCGQNNTPRD
jgi:hypothetical protein